MIRQCSRCWKSEYKNKQAASSKIRNMPSSTDQEQGSTNQDANSADFIFGPLLIKPNKVIRVWGLFHRVFKGNPKTCFVRTLEVLWWDLKGVVNAH